MAEGNTVITIDDSFIIAWGGSSNSVRVESAAEVDDERYGRQTVTVNGQVIGNAAGVYLDGGGRVVIGPQGSVGAASGIAILATGDTPPEMTGDPSFDLAISRGILAVHRGTRATSTSTFGVGAYGRGGPDSHGIDARNLNTSSDSASEVRVTTLNTPITTWGALSHGIYARHFSSNAERSIAIDVGGDIHASWSEISVAVIITLKFTNINKGV